MACVCLANYAILINGEPSLFLKISRGLRQGCLLSPYPFLLIIKGFNKLIHIEKRKARLEGIRISSQVNLRHLIFIDDLLLFGKGSLEGVEGIEGYRRV